jgi:prepilin-type N-terminal cleavage/methylation domain-containing protein
MQRLSLRSALRRDSGFSLVELIVVVAILGILVIVAIPVYGAIQATATQTSLNVAAANAYTGLTQAYSTGGADAASAYVKGVNAKNDTIQLQVRDLPKVPFDGEENWKGRFEQDLEFNNTNTDPRFGPFLNDQTVMSEYDEYMTSPGYSGGYFCVISFDISKGFPVKTLGFAGDYCGPGMGTK